MVLAQSCASSAAQPEPGTHPQTHPALFQNLLGLTRSFHQPSLVQKPQISSLRWNEKTTGQVQKFSPFPFFYLKQHKRWMYIITEQHNLFQGTHQTNKEANTIVPPSGLNVHRSPTDKCVVQFVSAAIKNLNQRMKHLTWTQLLLLLDTSSLITWTGATFCSAV